MAAAWAAAAGVERVETGGADRSRMPTAYPPPNPSPSPTIRRASAATRPSATVRAPRLVLVDRARSIRPEVARSAREARRPDIAGPHGYQQVQRPAVRMR